jgi:hypothetical protein
MWEEANSILDKLTASVSIAFTLQVAQRAEIDDNL